MAFLHALLLTDVVESTRLTERLAEEAATALWSAHDRMARDLIPKWRGREIDKTDGMLLLFDVVSDAVGYALAYHTALHQHGLGISARAGIHFGPIGLRANPAEDVARGAKPIEVDGIALPMVARIMAIAAGGQTLLSEDARRALGEYPVHILAQGHWQLHGISQPIELFEVARKNAQVVTPADGPKAYRVVRQGDLWQPLQEVRHSLPAERDAFVGRQECLRALAAKFESSARLVSVLGMGGVGKTRLATRFAWSQRGDHPGGVWFCDLSRARGMDGILFSVAQGLEVPLGQTDPVVQLGQAIAGRGKCLVVLDNFEQVAKFAEVTLGRWLERAPLARFLVTTRQVLGVVGEDIFAVPPLDRGDAVELFLKRANAARYGYGKGPENLVAVHQLVRVLDNLPLAIELAAARARTMSPRTLLARMKDRFDVLLSSANRHTRQATLRATFDWSWELLTESERATLARLSVFQGGFNFESASAVADVGAMERTLSMFDLVQCLVDKSFVRQVSDDRFDLLESVREYAAQHLCAPQRFERSGPECEAETRCRHWRYFAVLEEAPFVADRCAELDNLVVACRAAAAAQDGDCATGCLIGAWAVLRLTGPYRAAVELSEVVAQIASLTDREAAEVHWVSGSALDMLGEGPATLPHLEAGLRFASLAKDAGCTVRLLLVLGNRQTLDGDVEGALTSLTEAEQLSRGLGDDQLLASALNGLGRLMDHQSRFAEAKTQYETALSIARLREDHRAEGSLLGNLGSIHHALGDIDQALDHYERGLALSGQVADRRSEGNGRCNLGLLYQEQGRNVDARTQFELALSFAREMGHVRLAYTVLCNLGILFLAESRFREAAQHLEQAVKDAVASSDRLSEGQFRGYLALALARQGMMRGARASIDRGEELLRTSADRLSYALLLCDRAEIEGIASQSGAATEALQLALHIADELGCGPDSALRRRLVTVGMAPNGNLSLGGTSSR